MPATSPASAAPPRVGLLVLLGAMTAFGAMSIDMYLPALPTMGRALGAGPGAVALTLSAFIAGMGAGQILWGPLSDRIGRRRPVLIGVALYIAASIACALAPTIEPLIAARFVQGVGGCASLVVARAVVRDRWDTVETARIFSYLTLVMGLAPVLAPAIGALLLGSAGWRSVFWVLAIFGAVVGAAVLSSLPETRDRAAARRARAEPPWRTYARLLGHRRLIGYVLAAGAASGALFAYIVTSPALFIEGFGLTPDAFAWLFGANALGFIGAAQLNRWALRRLDPDAVVARALVFGVVVAVAFAFAAWAKAGPWPTAALLFLILAGFGLQQANLGAGALAVDPDSAGAIAAISGVASFGLGASVAAVAGLVQDGTALPPALVILVCYVVSASAFFGLARR